MTYKRHQPNPPTEVELKKYPKSGIEILEIDKKDSPRRIDWRYVVELICCGKRRTVHHRSLLRRLMKKRCVCDICQAVFINDEIPKKWRHFEENRNIDEAGLLVLKVLLRRSTQEATVYYVEKNCCGHREEMSHIEILRRIIHRRKSFEKNPNRSYGCWKCSPRHSSQSHNFPEISRHMEEFVVMPTWPIPPGLRGKDPGIWEDGSYPT